MCTRLYYTSILKKKNRSYLVVRSTLSFSYSPILSHFLFHSLSLYFFLCPAARAFVTSCLPFFLPFSSFFLQAVVLRV